MSITQNHSSSKCTCGGRILHIPSQSKIYNYLERNNTDKVEVGDIYKLQAYYGFGNVKEFYVLCLSNEINDRVIVTQISFRSLLNYSWNKTDIDLGIISKLSDYKIALINPGHIQTIAVSKLNSMIDKQCGVVHSLEQSDLVKIFRKIKHLAVEF